MLRRRVKRIRQLNWLQIRQRPIGCTLLYKYLGILFDSSLTFTNHMHKIFQAAEGRFQELKGLVKALLIWR